MQTIDDSNEWINWIEEAIAKDHLKHYEYENFSNIREISSGGFGKVYRANWKNSLKHFALKSFFNFDTTTAKEIVNEVITILTCISVIIICTVRSFRLKKFYQLSRLNFNVQLIFMIMLFVFMVLQLPIRKIMVINFLILFRENFYLQNTD
jgi:hypothetical protein